MIKNFDYVIVGAGIIGLTIAKELVKRGYNRILILEKESELGAHASGRNSGVLHAGIYYSTDSLKAKFCSSGSQLMKQYAHENGIPVHNTGKVVVAYQEDMLGSLETLYQRSLNNSIRVEKIDEKQLKELEPEAFTLGWAVYSPDTSVIDPKKVLASLQSDLKTAGVQIQFQEQVMSIDMASKTVTSTLNTFGYGHLINAAGAFADKISHMMDVGLEYVILPFKGVYCRLNDTSAQRIRGSIYPAPDLSVPFLGVHLTRGASGLVYVGPTAIPAFGRENYGILKGINFSESPLMFKNILSMFFKNENGFRRMVITELSKYSHVNLVNSARKLAPKLALEDFERAAKVGIRAQLINKEKLKLEMDFILESGLNSTHILNSISPAFSSSMAFSKMVVDGIEKQKE